MQFFIALIRGYIVHVVKILNMLNKKILNISFNRNILNKNFIILKLNKKRACNRIDIINEKNIYH